MPGVFRFADASVFVWAMAKNANAKREVRIKCFFMGKKVVFKK